MVVILSEVEESTLLTLTLKTKKHRFFTRVQNDINATWWSFRVYRGIYIFVFQDYKKRDRICPG